MRRCFLIVFHFLFCVIAFAQQSEWRELIDKKQFEEVISQAANMHPADTADFSKMYLVGQAYEGLLRYKSAYNYYKQCYALASTRTDMLSTLARISVNIGKGMEAEKYYKQVIEYDSTNFFANYQLARLYVQMGNNSEGIKHYNFLLERDAENTVLLRAIGDSYTNMDSLYQALEYYDKAFYGNMENASTASLLINTLLNLYDPMFNNYIYTASFVCDTALFYNPKDRTLRQKRAMIYYVEKKYEEADSVYTSLISEGDSSLITLKFGGFSRYSAKRYYQAIDLLLKAFQKDSMAYDVCIRLGGSFARMGLMKQGLQYLDKAEILMEPDEYWTDAILRYRAEAYSRSGDCAKGSQYYYKIWQKDKEDISILYTIHRCFAARIESEAFEITEEDRHRYMFACYIYTVEALRLDYRKNNAYMRSVLRKIHEEMFFRGEKSLTMISPDNKKNSITIEKIKELIDQLQKE